MEEVNSPQQNVQNLSNPVSQVSVPQIPESSNNSRLKLFTVLFLSILLSLFSFIFFLVLLNYFRVIDLNLSSSFFTLLPKKALTQNISNIDSKLNVKPNPSKASDIDYSLVTTKLGTIPSEFKPENGFYYFSKNGKKVAFQILRQLTDPTDAEALKEWDNLFIGADKIKSVWKFSDIVFSPDGLRIAYVYQNDFDSATLVIDGSEIKIKKEAAGIKPIFSPDSKKFAYLVSSYGPNTGFDQYIVFNSRESKHYEDINDLQFNLRGDLSYQATVAEGDERVVINDQEGKVYNYIPTGSLIFAKEGNDYAYLASDKNYWYVVKNGSEISKYSAKEVSLNGSVIKLSLNGNHLAYSLARNQKESIILDGKEGKEFDKIENFVFSPNGEHLAYVAITGDLNNPESKTHLVVDGVEKKTGVSATIAFDYDSKDLAYFEENRIIENGKLEKVQYYLVNGNKRYPAYISPLSYYGFSIIKFSKDNKNIAYIGYNVDNTFDEKSSEASFKKKFIVVNDKKGKEYDDIFDFEFSPDGTKIMYSARQGNELWWVVDSVI